MLIPFCFFHNYSKPPTHIRKNRTILVLYLRCLHASMTHQLLLFSVVLNSKNIYNYIILSAYHALVIIIKKKKTCNNCKS
ncbi:hypothetical protein DWV78_02060 [Agathobacter rectalis]|uniref:Uncharacterized protein n=1 Tax=Agathobacter rectalis TaxID=39491 RepID=A0A413BKS5_9FIRM|nr:hypothetical protein DWV78_02060 [Agathobacter rectalis]